MLKLHRVLRRALHYYWPGMRTDVEAWIQDCCLCQTHKGPTPKLKAPLQPISMLTLLPFGLVAMDIMELPLTYKGNQYVLVFQDYCTQWVEAYAIPDQRAECIAQLFLAEVVRRYGAPCKLLSDCAANLTAAVIQQVYQICSTKKIQTTPYHPQTDGLVERSN